jgi:gliding motility-associated-like protein
MIFKKYFSIASLLTLWLAMEISFSASAQTLDCSSPPSYCLSNPLLQSSEASFGDMTPYGPVKIDGWDISHGTPSYSEENGVWLWSYSGATHGEGIYTCYNFQKDRTYRVCLEAKTGNAPGTLGYEKGFFFIQASNGNFDRPIPVSNQVIRRWQLQHQDFRSFQFTFTANRTYSRLWLFPFMAEPPDGPGSQYEVMIKKIIVQEVTPPATFVLQNDTISISYQPTSSGYWSWSPASAVRAANADSSVVKVQVCDTTPLRGTFISACAVCDTAQINVLLAPDKPSTSITGPSATCSGQAVELRASGADSFHWISEATTEASIRRTPSQTHTYYVTGHKGICSDTTSHTVEVFSTFQTLQDTSICEGSSIHLPNHSMVQQAGTYTSTLLSAAGCDSIVTTTVSLHQNYRIHQDVLLSHERSYTLPDGNLVHESGYYEVVLPTQNHCDSLIALHVSWQLWIPNLITPNGDQHNDRFEIGGLPRSSHLYLYNHWGELIYEHSSYDQSWPGKPTTDGLYYYLLRIPGGTEYKGWLQLLHE